MLDISVSKTKVRGRPKGRPGDKPVKHSDQIIYPENIPISIQIKGPMWVIGDFFRRAVGDKEKYTTRYQSDLYK